jgi:hypothetical protein
MGLMPPATYRGSSIFQEVSFQSEHHDVEALGGLSRRIMGRTTCEITLSFPVLNGDNVLGLLMHDTELSDAAKLRLLADSLDSGIPEEEPEFVRETSGLNPVSTGVRDWEL